MSGRSLRKKRAVKSTNDSPKAKQPCRESRSVGTEEQGNDSRIYIKEEIIHEDLTNPPILIQDIRTIKKEEEESSIRDAEFVKGYNIIPHTNELTNDTIRNPLSTDKSPSHSRQSAVSIPGQINKSQPNVSRDTRKINLGPHLVVYPLTQDGGLKVEGVTGSKGNKINVVPHTEIKSVYSSTPDVDPFLIQCGPNKIYKRWHNRQQIKDDKLNDIWCSDSSSMETFEFTKKRAWLMPPTCEPADYFNYFIDDSYLEEISEATNKEALSKKNCRINCSFVRGWTDLTVSELKIFIGLLLHTGTAKMTHLGDYWRQHRLYKSCFRDYMTPQRFTAILRFLTVHDGANDTDRIATHFNSVMDTIYYPGRNLNLDVYVVNWDQKAINFQRNVKIANIRFITVSEQDGMIVRMVIGSTNRKTSDAETCVFNLLEGKLDIGHSLNVSSLFKITPDIAMKLLQRKTYCTAVEIRDVPKDLLTQELVPGHNRSVFRKGVHVGKYNSGSATTYYLSTEFKNDMKKSKSSQFNEPAAISYHEEKYNAIERTDLFEYYPCEVYKLVRQRKVFVHSLMLSLLNANLLCNAFSKAPMNFSNYRLRVIEHLLPEREGAEEKPKLMESRSTNTEYDENGGVVPINDASRLKHRLTKIRKTILRRKVDGRVVNATSRRQCANCRNNKMNRMNTCYECVACKRSPATCMNCFFETHKVSLYY